MAEPRSGRLADRTPLLGHSAETARPSRCDAFTGAHATPAGSPPRSARISRPLARSKPKPSLRRQVQHLRLCPSAPLRSLRQSSAIRGRARADRNRWWCGGETPAIAMPFRCAPPAMPNSTGSASLPSGRRSTSILSTWLCGCGLCRPMWRPGSALSFGLDNGSIWRRHILRHRRDHSAATFTPPDLSSCCSWVFLICLCFTTHRQQCATLPISAIRRARCAEAASRKIGPQGSPPHPYWD
jgi:hypothetical protein